MTLATTYLLAAALFGGSAISAPVPTSTSSITLPPEPTSPSGIKAWSNAFYSILELSTWATIGAQGVGEITPHFSLDYLAKLIAIGQTNLPPNYNTDFDAVEGVPSSQVKWLTQAPNRTEDDPVIIYLHGGGYVVSAVPVHATNIYNLYKEVGNDRLSILWVDYTLTLQAAYPTQLTQAAAVYNQLAKSCNNIILEGDSAGGHLILNMVRTIEYPVDGVDSLSSVPSGLALLSPAVTFGINPNNGTMKENFGKDILDAQALNQMGYLLAKGDETLQYSVFFNQWDDYIDWKKILPDPSKIFTTYGEIEVLRGPIETFLDISLGGHSTADSGSTVVIEEQGQHDGLLLGTSSSLFAPWVEFHKEHF